MKTKIIRYFKNLGHKNIKISRMPEAWSNFHTYKVSTNKDVFVLKIFMDYIQDEKKVALREYKLLKLFKNIAPKVISFDANSFGHPAILMEFVRGGSMDKWKFTDKDVNNITKLLAKIHSTKISSNVKNIFRATQPKIPSDSKKIKTWIKRLKNKQISKRLLRIAENAPKPNFGFKPTICHGDFKQGNIINSNKGLKVVDWETAHIGDPAEDFAQLFYLADYWKQGPSKRQRQIMISKYKKLRKEKDNFEQRINWWYSNRKFPEVLWDARHTIYFFPDKMKRVKQSISKLEKKWI